jgi:flagellar biosynthesis component FlhA
MSKAHFLFKNLFWDLFFQKLFSQLISIKLWILLGAAILLIVGLITGAQLVTIWLATLGVKGAYEIADVFKTAKDKKDVVDNEDRVGGKNDDDIKPHRLYQQSEERSIQRMLKGV